MNKYLKKYNISNYLFIILVIICGMLSACEDNFKDTIKNENSANEENNNGNSGGGNIIDPGPGWVKKAYVSTPRAGAAAAIADGYIYIYGGENDLGIYGDFGRFNFTAGSFAILTSFDKIAYADMVVLNNILYVFGGKESGGNTSKNLKYYNITNNLWDEVEAPSGFTGSPTERYSHVTAGYIDPGNSDNILFIHGGFAAPNGDLYQINLSETPKPDWQEVSNINLLLAEHAAVIHNDKIYFFGGINPNTSEYRNDLYAFDIQAAKSVPLPFAKLNPGGYISPRSGIKMVATDDGLYVYGGKNASGCLNDFWFYSFSDNRWEYIGIGPGKRCHYNAFMYSNKLYIYGGYYKDNTGQQIFYCDLWEYQLN